MKINKIRDLSETQKENIVRLWNAEYPEKLRLADSAAFDAYLSKLGDPEHYLLTDKSEEIRGWLACFRRDGAKWFAMIVDTSEQRKGYGSMLLSEVKKFETQINGWVMDRSEARKSDGDIYLSPIGFYLKNGFRVLEDVRSETGTISTVKIRWEKV